MNFLIDGYNLMHFLGLVRPNAPRSLEKSRIDLQEWLCRAHGKQIESVAIVFDGRVTVGKPNDVQSDRGLRIYFSAGEPADDLIADLIKAHSRPERLTVVSNDRRVQEAARRRGCVVWSCSDYLDWVLDRGEAPPKPPPLPDKPPSTAEETEHWLKEFSDLENDPELREFNRMYEDFRDG